MAETNQTDVAELMSLTTEIVSSHVSNNPISASDLPDLIKQVYDSLYSISQPEQKAEKLPEPAVSIRKSVTPDHIICLEDGKRLKMLKRHLMTAYNMTPAEYRARWNLPSDYPMVAPNYAARRRELAKIIGLGNIRRGKSASSS